MSVSALMKLSEALREAIRRDGRPLTEIGEAAGVDHGRLSRFMRAKRTLTLPAVEAVCRALGVECRLVHRRRRKGG